MRWAAEHRYPYVALAPPLNVIDEIYDLYDEVAARTGFVSTSEHPRVRHPGERRRHRREAYEEGRHFFWQLGTSFGVAPRHWLQPRVREPRSDAEPARASPDRRPERHPRWSRLSYEEAHATYQIVSGNPDTVVKKLQRIIDVVDPGYMIFWGREGLMSHDVAVRASI